MSLDVAAPPVVATAGRQGLARAVLARPVALIGVVILTALIVSSALAGLFAQDPFAQDYAAILRPPSPAHLLGTDELGRDTLARLLHGTRVSLFIALVSTLATLAVAVPVGVVAGYFGGALDTVIARLVDVTLAFPYVIVAILLAVILGPSIPTVVIAISIGNVPIVTRIVRARVLTVKELGFVTGAVVDGAGHGRILVRHVLPSLLDVLLVQTSIVIPVAILSESALSYLGLGVRPPTPTWGSMLADAQPLMESAPWLAVFPGLVIFLAALAFNLVGDAIRDELDPKTRRRG